jgi:hypothetical protein
LSLGVNSQKTAWRRAVLPTNPNAALKAWPDLKAKAAGGQPRGAGLQLARGLLCKAENRKRRPLWPPLGVKRCFVVFDKPLSGF